MKRHLELDAAWHRRLECVPTGRYKMTSTTNKQLRVREGRQTRDAILTAAKRLILIKGYNATSLDDLLGASGVGKGSFYHYFESKEDLGYAILDDIVTSFVERTLDPCFPAPHARPIPHSASFLHRLS